MRPSRLRLLPLFVVLVLVVGACGGGENGATSPPTAPTLTTTSNQSAGGTASTGAPESSKEEAEEEEGTLVIDAAPATVTVDGDPSDWASISSLDLTLEPIKGENVDPKMANVKVAYDSENVYVLLSVSDDYNWNPDDPHLSGAAAVQWAIEPAAGEHMGTDAPDGEGPSLGLVDIWHWELECGPGVASGGINGPAGGDPGNDGVCNLDDEWATDPDTREDDNGPTAENSILGVFSHSAQVEDADGWWYFEFSRPLITGDEQDAQFTMGNAALLAVAYWDPDVSPQGWDGDQHVQSANHGWITVNLEN